MTPKAAGYGLLVATGLLAALVVHQPAAVVLVTPFAVALVGGILAGHRPTLDIGVAPSTLRAVQGDEVSIEVDVTARGSGVSLELALAPGPGLDLGESSPPRSTRLARDETRTFTFTVTCDRWGRPPIGQLAARVRDPAGLFVAETVWNLSTRLRVVPDPLTLQQISLTLHTRAFAGRHLTPHAARGIEFADIRDLAPGEAARDVNWRRTARGEGVWVNTRHPERSADVVLFVDTFSGDALDASVRCGAALATDYLNRRDRVGVVTFGGTVRWLHPRGGTRQLHEVIDVLLAADHFDSAAWKDIAHLPATLFPPRSLVIAVSCLGDERGVMALSQLQARRVDLAVIAVCTEEGARSSSVVDTLAYRLWRLERRITIDRLRRGGVAVGEWQEGTPLGPTLEEVIACRRRAHVRA
jgi:uncharacterized protein (DUF58 family)